MDLSGAVQGVSAALQAAGQAAQPALQALEVAAAPVQATARLQAVDAAKKLVRLVGVDSNLPNSDTPASEDGARTMPALPLSASPCAQNQFGLQVGLLALYAGAQRRSRDMRMP